MTHPPFLTSKLLGAIPGIEHGFFTRQGGISKGLYSSLNTGFGSSDDRAAVEENRDRICAALGTTTLHTVYQVHSARVVAAENAGEEADGLVSDIPGEAVGVLTADCVPILMATADGSKVAAVHAGWKGAVNGIVSSALKAMGGGEIVAAIGPAIAQDSYEVGAEVRQAAADPAFFKDNGKPGKFQFDLPGFVAKKLQVAGVSQLEILREDTYSQPDRFFSYRRATHLGELDYGRQISVIGRKG
ncbi:MAG: peptidoglycan editing factor PgeF [Pseudomonadota bacterium]